MGLACTCTIFSGRYPGSRLFYTQICYRKRCSLPANRVEG